jgi:FecR protein
MGGGCERISSHRLEAVVTDAKNARRNGSDTLLAGEKIAGGTDVQTAANGRADLMLLPNMLLRLQENSELRITGLKFSADGNETTGGVRERAAVVRLSRGQVIGRLEQHGYNTASLAFETSRAQIRAQTDALFEVNEQPDASSATCLRGYVGVALPSDKHVHTVWAGETMVMEGAGFRRITLAPPERAAAEAHCGSAEAALQLEAAAQMEARR